MTTETPPDPDAFWIITTNDKDVLHLKPGLAVNLTDHWAIFLTPDNVLDTILPRENIHHMKLIHEDPAPSNVVDFHHPTVLRPGTGRHR